MNKNLALFDFDGTITTKDSLSDFFKFVEPNPIKFYYYKYLFNIKDNIGYKLGFIDLDKLKKSRIEAFFHKKKYTDLLALGDNYAKMILPELIKKSALEAIDNHLINNDDVYIVSASIDIILKNWCFKKNIGLITNNIDSGSNNYLGRDCNYEEKLIRIKQSINLEKYNFIYAYGDTEGDKYMLEIANYKFYQYFN
jgi:HAD superfamily phosphoserine phosphatase-like hydrolase